MSYDLDLYASLLYLAARAFLLEYNSLQALQIVTQCAISWSQVPAVIKNSFNYLIIIIAKISILSLVQLAKICVP